VGKKANYSTKDRQRWMELLEILIAQPRTIVQARTYKSAWRTNAQPVLLRCNDGKDYVVKGQNAGRQIINEQIVARLGLLLGAPVVEPQIVEISAEFIEIEKNLAHIPAGTAHGSLYLEDCFHTRDLIATDEPKNRSRLSLMALLYGWVYAGDQQFLFKNDPPRLIYSVDHGHFFPNGADWMVKDLVEIEDAQIDPYLLSNCNFTSLEVRQALDALAKIHEEEIIRVVAYPPEEWDITINERTMMIEYLITRKESLLKLR